MTGSSGFIGLRVLDSLLNRGYRNLRCLVRPSRELHEFNEIVRRHGAADTVEVVRGNLLSAEDCVRATGGVAVIYHLAVERSNTFADALMNSVVPARNLLEAARGHGCLKRFVNVSSFSVYSNRDKRRGRLLDEECPLETNPEQRGDAYTYGKCKQDEIVKEYGHKSGIPYVIVRPGVVYGPGDEGISNRVGIGRFGIFLHMGGSNAVPLTYVDNCADAIILAGLKSGVDGEVFNVVDDDLPSSRRFIQLYKRNVKHLMSIYVPHAASYLLCCLWELCSAGSQGRLPPKFNRKSWHAFWKKTRYSNSKLKDRLDWTPRVSSHQALMLYFEGCRQKQTHACNCHR